jgi:hypothetical protein
MGTIPHCSGQVGRYVSC